MNFARIFNYVSIFKTEFPECAATNDYRMIICVATVVALFLGKTPLESNSRAFFKKYLPELKFPIGSEVRDSKAEMLGERIFKLVINVFCVVSLVLIMNRDDCDFFDVRIGGTV